jgi:2-C-methyl-D-erythritol 4-phosphate cytidylyltransferase
LKKFAIIVAGGTGTRMNAGIPKQFLLLRGKPMLMYSIEAFHRAFPEIIPVIALPEEQFPAWQTLCNQHAFTLPHILSAGGATRFHSVQNALNSIDDEGLVAIHDGARPLVTELDIRSAFFSAAEFGNAVPVVPFTESVRMVSGIGIHSEGSRVVDRTSLRVVQTPQVFQTALLKKAYRQDFREGFTDDATVVESIGETIHLIDGDPLNLKITHPYDLAAAGIMLDTRNF